MNSSAATNGGGSLSNSSNIGGFAYAIGVSIGILLLITTITVASYFCARTTQDPTLPYSSRRRTHHRRRWPDHEAEPPQRTSVEVGLDEETIASYPKLLYSEAKLKRREEEDTTASSCCSICLGDYKDADALRLLPDCGHIFHVKCVDPWLRLHPTCPLCRTSPFPTPLSTPLAEVVPLATTRH